MITEKPEWIKPFFAIVDNRATTPIPSTAVLNDMMAKAAKNIPDEEYNRWIGYLIMYTDLAGAEFGPCDDPACPHCSSRQGRTLQ